eukprot:TRINITY_DN9646_c0_g1_i1.p2 TRINITY_DN9646_c0_g1~~TRINITY_DN9646_c0_g1_i1.p2  ORF type:complete len:226 (+),score=-9.10 TRINITY_DN9646_c0_g1_i1:109-786(+)
MHMSRAYLYMSLKALQKLILLYFYGSIQQINTYCKQFFNLSKLLQHVTINIICAIKIYQIYMYWFQHIIRWIQRNADRPPAFSGAALDHGVVPLFIMRILLGFCSLEKCAKYKLLGRILSLQRILARIDSVVQNRICSFYFVCFGSLNQAHSKILLCAFVFLLLCFLINCTVAIIRSAVTLVRLCIRCNAHCLHKLTGSLDFNTYPCTSLCFQFDYRFFPRLFAI